MNLYLLFLHNVCTSEKSRDILALIALELNHLAKHFVLHNRTVAAELFLEILEDFLVAELFLEALDCGQSFPTIPLLYADMHILFPTTGTS